MKESIQTTVLVAGALAGLIFIGCHILEQTSTTQSVSGQLSWTISNRVLPPIIPGEIYAVDLNGWVEGPDAESSTDTKWEIVRNGLPAGLSINNGVIAGKPQGTNASLVMRISRKDIAIEHQFLFKQAETSARAIP